MCTVPAATALQLPGRVSLVALAAGLSLAFQAEPSPRSVREIDFRSYLIRTRHLDECRTLLPDTPLEPIHFLEVEYADLDHDGREEAVVEGATCAMGTGGCDIVEVFRLTGRGLEPLRISDDGLEQPPYEDRGMGSTPRLDVRDGQLTRWWVVNAKFPEGPRSGWKRTVFYRWVQDRFVVDRIEEVSPAGGT